MTRSSLNWGELPGSFDTVNARWLFASDHELGIPQLRSNSEITAPETLIPYRTRVRNPQVLAQSGLHFWLDDYRFEIIWSRPLQTLNGLDKYGTILTPDFSLYRDWPLAIQIWNTYRTRWVGAFWQAHGLPVIPTVSWSSPASYSFCFAGIPQGSVVAIAKTDYRDVTAKRYFILGFEAMWLYLQPSTVLCYGELPPELLNALSATDLAKIKNYPTRWQTSSLRAKTAPHRSIALATGTLAQPIAPELAAAMVAHR